MGHLNWDAIKCVHSDKPPLLSIKLDTSELRGACDGCIAGKGQCRTFKSSKEPRASEPLELIHSDLAGPMETISIGGKHYFCLFIDDCTRYVWIILMRRKSETFKAFKAFVMAIEKSTGQTIRFFRSDRGGEFMSDKFSEFLKERGITRQTSTPHTPQQNGLAERMMRTLVGSALAMLHHAGMSKGFWAEAAVVAAHLHNRSPRHGLNFRTPHELLFRRPPDIDYLWVFGC